MYSTVILAVGGFISSCIIYVVGLCLYRLSPLHPLSKYPGPFLAKITPYYGFYHAYQGNTHRNILRLHERYGKFVRYSPNRLLFNSSRAYKDIHGHGKNVRKSSSYSLIIERPGWHSTASAIDKVEHGRKRKLVSTGLSDAALRQYEIFMLDRIGVFCGELIKSDNSGDSASGWSATRNMSDWCNYLTFDIMAAVAFGKSFSLLEVEENRFIPKALDKVVHRSAVYYQLPNTTFTIKSRLDKFLFGKDTKSGAARIAQIAIDFANERIARMTEKKDGDVMSNVLNAKNPHTGEGFPLAEIQAESRMLIIAGSDTSSAALAAAFFYLSQNKEAYEKVTSEVRGAFGNVDEIRSGPALTGCVYLRACIEECLRMTPPAPGAMYREVQTGGVMIDGELIPAGYDVGVASYALHHNEEHFPDSFNFQPERWLQEGNSPQAIEERRAAFMPFLMGPRACIGKAMAYQEIFLSLATVIYQFDFEMVGELGKRKVNVGGVERVEFKTDDHFTSGKDGPMVRFRIREGI